jgi:predicted Fe-Mo cluster-binding NifX family protein
MRRSPALTQIAVPNCQGRVSPVLDTAVRLLVVTRRRGEELERKEFVLTPLPPEALARSVADLRVNVLLCAALSESLLRLLEQSGVQVVPHVCGDIEDILRAYCCGRLSQPEFRMPGCWGRHLDGDCCQRQPHSARAGKPAGKHTRANISAR